MRNDYNSIGNNIVKSKKMCSNSLPVPFIRRPVSQAARRLFIGSVMKNGYLLQVVPWGDIESLAMINR
jgi:hypothetical protein